MVTDRIYLSKFRGLREQVDCWLRSDLDSMWSSTILSQACRYSILAQGKRIRPVLCLASAELLEVAQERVEAFAVSLEYIHVFSLIHDDLPALDNDDMRRGQPSCHRKFNEATALLAGDVLVGRAFGLLGEYAPGEAAYLVKLLGGALVELCDGQMMDLEASGRGCDATSLCSSSSQEQERLLEARHLKKTAALMKASLLGPVAFLAEADRGEIEGGLGFFANNLGLLFQITDDILDVTSSAESMGKQTGADARQGTPSYVSVYGLEKARSLAETSAARAKAALKEYGSQADFLNWLCDYVLKREA